MIFVVSVLIFCVKNNLQPGEYRRAVQVSVYSEDSSETVCTLGGPVAVGQHS